MSIIIKVIIPGKKVNSEWFMVDGEQKKEKTVLGSMFQVKSEG
jgi:hypothetical protein